MINNDRFLDKTLHSDEVQRELGLSYDTLNKRLVSVMGMTFNDYLIYLRLDFSCKLLTNTNLTIDAVADRSGFKSTRTFQRQFKDKYNISPSQFRLAISKDVVS